MADIASLIEAIESDRRLAREVLEKLPKLITDDGDVAFDLSPTVAVPTVKKLHTALTMGGITELSNRISSQERLSINLIQEAERLAQVVGKSRVNPSWKPVDMGVSNNDGQTNNPMYRANIEYGLRFPYEGYSVRRLDRRYADSAKQIGTWLLPNFVENLVTRTASGTLPTSVLNVFANNAFNFDARYSYNYWYWHDYYGHYWYWYRYYGWYSYSYTTTTYSTSNPAVANLSGYAWLGQTLQVSKPQVCTGVELGLMSPGTYKAAALPKILLVRAKQGAPVLTDVICEGTFAEDVNYANVAGTPVKCRVNWNMPVLLKAGEQVAIVIGSKARFDVVFSGNIDQTGQVFACQDAYFWVGDSSKDLCYNLICADFGSNTRQVIEINPMELSGGISSAKLQLVQQANQNGTVGIEVQINDTWQPISVLENNIDLPPYTPARLVMTGDKDVMPMINTDASNITVFRPTNKMTFITKPRTVTGDTVKLVFESAGFDPILHKLEYTLLTNGGATIITPTVAEHSTSADGKVRTTRATFKLPAGLVDWQIRVAGETVNPARLFDVTSIVELV